MSPSVNISSFLLTLSLLLITVTAATTRGLALGSEPLAQSDLAKLVASGSPVKWYYTWSLYPNDYLKSQKSNVKFFPLVNPDQANSGLASTLNGLRANSDHLLTFNEPDIPAANGGNPIEPAKAAQLYIDHIVPLREKGWKISHPVVSGSPQGRAWLQKFRDACQARKPGTGCASDFVSVHFYGNLDGLKDHLDQLRAFYNPNASGLKFYITEIGYPSASESENLKLLKGAAPYLDGLSWVEGFAWFGSFRQRDANSWTGPGLALFNNNGNLTSVGKYYVNK
ncbi:glycoside hydrolase family 128 protein [Apiospora rasikravindrae]|uniref:Glycoside hydrolase family 128 protein n=1 Tax=Apiospora rasikravindrae TaxID=990691 RepID=A0ABR1SZU7_9PEZI